jgi:colanic acid/amylovoran biosynthesis protein
VRNSSVVISSGGLYFAFVKRGFVFTAYHLFAFSYPLLLARRLGVPYFLYAQSFGPFCGAFSRWWMRKLVAGSTATWARESYSRDVLLSIGAESGKIDIVPDAAFGLRRRHRVPPSIPGMYDLENENYAVISARSLEHSGHNPELCRSYLRSLTGLIDWLTTEKGMMVAIVAHTIGPLDDEDDRIVSRDLFRAAAPSRRARLRLIEDDLSPENLRELYGAARVVVATRFHAAVLALAGGTPVIAIPYFGVKTQGSFRDLGLSDCVICVEDLSTEKLNGKVLEILDAGQSLRDFVTNLAEERYSAAIGAGKRLRRLIDMDNLDSSLGKAVIVP